MVLISNKNWALCAEFGVTSTVRNFNKKFTDLELKESTVRTWANQCKEELATKKKKGEDMTVVKLVSKKCWVKS